MCVWRGGACTIIWETHILLEVRYRRNVHFRKEPDQVEGVHHDVADKHGGHGTKEEGIVREVLFQTKVVLNGNEDDQVGNDVLRVETAEREKMYLYICILHIPYIILDYVFIVKVIWT